MGRGDGSRADGLTRAELVGRAGGIACVLAAPAAFAACRGGSAERSASRAATAPPPVAQVSRSAGAVTALPRPATPVSVFGWDVASTRTDLGRALASVAARWAHANPGSTLTFDGAPYSDFVDAATARARAHDLGDVVELLPGVTHAALFAALRPLRTTDFGDLGTRLSGWPGASLDPSDPTAFAGVPIGSQGPLWYYNRALFVKAGLDAARPPETWKEFAAAADALKEAGIVPIGMSGLDSMLAWWAWSAFSPQAFSTSAEVLRVRTGEIPLDDHRFLRTLEPLRESYTRGWWNPRVHLSTLATIESGFSGGQIGMVPGLIANEMNWQLWDAKLGRDGYGVFPAPRLSFSPPRARQACTPALLLGIGNEARNVKGAASWISSVASAQGQTTLLAEAGQLPNRRDVDVAAVSGSAGAVAITDLIAGSGGLDVAQNQFSEAARGVALQKLTGALTGGDLEGFLADLAGLQAVA